MPAMRMSASATLGTRWAQSYATAIVCFLTSMPRSQTAIRDDRLPNLESGVGCDTATKVRKMGQFYLTFT